MSLSKNGGGPTARWLRNHSRVGPVRVYASVRTLKWRALECHQSQKPDTIWEVHDVLHRSRGAEAGVTYAEAYLQADSTKPRPKLPLSFLARKE